MQKPDFKVFFGEKVCKARPFYNFGSGNWRHPYFQNIDLEHEQYPNNKPDLPYDAFSLDPFDIESDTGKIFYISQVNEHLPDSVNRHIFSEIYRTLEAGGVLRIAYPSFERAVKAFEDGDRGFFLWDWNRGDEARNIRENHNIAQLFLDFFATRAQEGSPDDGNRKYTAAEIREMVSDTDPVATAEYVCTNLEPSVQRQFPGCHCNYWTFEKMKKFLADAGFVRIEKSAYLQSRIPPLRDSEFFDKTLPTLSAYVEARK